MKKDIFPNILVSLFIALGAFMVIGPELTSALENLDLKYDVGVYVDEDNFSQIVLLDSNGKETFLTNDAYTHSNPDISGNNVVWMAQIDSKWQIFFHQIQINKTIQLTNKGNNVNPKISGDTVVWEGFYKGTWQIYMFDGIKITRITTGNEPKQDVEIKGNQIAYSQKNEGDWEIHLYETADGTDQIISSGTSGRSPQIEDGFIRWSSFDEKGEVLYEFDKDSKKIIKLDRKVSTTSTPDDGMLDTASDNSLITEVVVEDEEEETEDEPKLEPVTTEDIIEEINQEIPESTPSADETPLPEQELIIPEDIEESTASSQ